MSETSPSLPSPVVCRKQVCSIVVTQHSTHWHVTFLLEHFQKSGHSHETKHDRLRRDARCSTDQIIKAAEVLGIQL
jgi:hypothetical protein